MQHQPMETAPRDGTPILTFWFNGCACADFNDYPVDKFDCWQRIKYPRGE